MFRSFLNRGVASFTSLLLPDHIHELLKADVGVMGPRGGLRVVLNSHGPLAGVHHSGTCAVIEVDVGDLDIIWEGCWVHSVVVVL